MRRFLTALLLLTLIGLAVGQEKRITLSFKNADLVYVIKVLAKEMNKNCFVSPDVEGTVTIELVNLTPEAALSLVLKSSGKGYDYRVMDDQRTIVVASSEKLEEIASNIMGSAKARTAGGGGPDYYPEPGGSAPVLLQTSLRLPPSNESYRSPGENSFQNTRIQPVSTFSSDVDTASYSNIRRILKTGYLPPPEAVRIEEMLNYFRYSDLRPDRKNPIRINAEVARCPWNDGHSLLRVVLQTRPMDVASLPPRNLVFLVDVSGSMYDENKLPLVRAGLMELVRTLRPEDHVAIVVYAGAEGLVMPATSGSEQATILPALDNLKAGGSTNGGAGIKLAYKVARQNARQGVVSRVILATDGDFNVGITSESDLQRLIESERDHGIYLSVLGFGTENIKDTTMEMLADKGNGNYAYIDTLEEARKVLIKQGVETLIPLANDVKLQVEFNPARVGSYRLIGYENRMLQEQDFKDDTKDAGELGPGHSVTALYELSSEAVPVERRYQQSFSKPSPELGMVKVRYKQPGTHKSVELSRAVLAPATLPAGSPDLRFAAAVAEFGMLLKDSAYRGTSTYESAKELARESAGTDPDRLGLVELIGLAPEVYRRHVASACWSGVLTARNYEQAYKARVFNHCLAGLYKACPEGFRGGILVRQEFILDRAPAARVVEFLQSQYLRVKFVPHPTLNGFYAIGPKKDILSIKSELPNLDRVPSPTT